MPTTATVPTDDVVVEFQRLMADQQNSLDGRFTKIEADVRSIRQAAAKPPVLLGAPGDGRESLGAQFVRDERVAAFLRNPQPGGIRIELPRPVLERRSAPTLTAATPITSATWPAQPAWLPGVVTRPRRRLMLRDVMSIFPLSTASLNYLVENAPVPANPGAGYQPGEGGLKPEISIGSTPATCTPSTIAAWVTCSRQALDDSLYLTQFIDVRLVYEVAYVEERELLLGDGAAGHITGLLQVATPYDTARTLANDTGLDVLSHSETQLEEIDVYPNAFVVNPHDAEKLRLTKNAQGSYVWEPDVSKDEAGLLWGLTPIVTNSMPRGQFLVGDFGPAAAQIIQREAAFVQISFEHADYFTKNLVAVRCESRIGLATYQPWAFVKGALTAGTAEAHSGSSKQK
jgi:HK97 family phage major capsid protein